MKKTIWLIISMMIMACISISAQTLSKDAKKQIKKMEKEGWVVNPGSLSLTEQYKKVYAANNEFNEDGSTRWIIGQGKSTGTAYNSVRKAAMTAAKTEIASSIQEEIAGSTDQGMANEEGEADGGSSMERTLSGAKTKFAQSLKNAEVLMECHRDLGRGRVEVQVTVACKRDVARKQLKDLLDEKMGWKK
jgi:hypothetical protein